jgi:hypothetical protein
MSAIFDPIVSAQSKQPATIAIAAIFPALSALVVSLRLYTRFFLLKLAGADDWLILLAWVRLPASALDGTLRLQHANGYLYESG